METFNYNNKKYEIDDFGRLWEVIGSIKKTLVIYPDTKLGQIAEFFEYKADPLNNLVCSGFHNAEIRKNK